MMEKVRASSGLQKSVYGLYRKILREAYKKDKLLEASTSFSADLRTGTTLPYARSEFRRRAWSVPRTDFQLIEFMIRQGHKDLKLMQMPGVQAVRGSH